MINKTLLIGHTGKDPEVRTLDNGAKVAKFNIATNESYKDKNTGELITLTDWHQVEAWGKLADIVERFIKKGSRAYVEGKYKSTTYEQDGQTKYVYYVKADVIRNLSPKDDSQFNASDFPANYSGGADDDLPF